MNDDDTPAEGRLADGTELADVVMDMPVEVRDGGTNDWRFGYVSWVENHIIFPRVWVELGNNRGSARATPYHTRFVRQYKEKKR